MNKRRDDMAEIMGAQIVAMVANSGSRGPADPMDPEKILHREAKEFMPTEWRKRPLRKRSRPRQVIADEIRGIFDRYVK